MNLFRPLLPRLFAILVTLAFGATSVLAQGTGSPLISLEDRYATQGWEAVGRLDIGVGGFCTATLIRDRLLLTAAHCVYDDNDRMRPVSDFTFKAGLRNGRAEATRSIVRIVAHPDFVSDGDIISTEAIANDIAVLELAQAIRVSNIQPFAIASRPRRGDDVAIVSYGKNRAEAPSLQRSCAILGRQGGTVVMNCDIESGSSGAPVFSMQDGRARIVSVVSAGARASATPISFGTSLEEPLRVLLAEFAARGPAQPGGEQRLISIGERNNTGAKFVSIGN